MLFIYEVSARRLLFGENEVAVGKAERILRLELTTRLTEWKIVAVNKIVEQKRF